jgi:hypothetical protein
VFLSRDNRQSLVSPGPKLYHRSLIQH